MTQPNFITDKVELTPVYGKFVISPLPSGFGHTLGNALRRTLLSSIKGCAVTYVKINDIVHPFTTIKGVKESALDIILNLKLLRLKTTAVEPCTVTFSTKGVGKVIGGDFKSGEVEVVNENHYIAELTLPKAKLDITLTVEQGKGYSPSEEKEKKEFGTLAVDSIFSPVVKVNYSVAGARVGRKTNFDKLMLEIFTDGTVSPEESLKTSARIMADYFNYILSGHDVKKTEEEKTEAGYEITKDLDKKVYQTIIDELDLPTRVINALLREKIETVEDLMKRGKNGLVGMKGLGEKSLDLIQKELEKLGVGF